MVKKALCVGLNYPQQKYQLYGCVNDCLDWERLLKETFQFEETRVLIDQNPDGSVITAPTQIPSRANILAQLGSWLVAGAQPGDVLVFVYAGHGCQVRTGYGQVDEALVPEDFGTVDAQGSPQLVMDDEVHALFSRLPAGCYLTVILDCCHGSHLLDVPTSIDTSEMPFRTLQGIERPREVSSRTAAGWEKAIIPHAQARPRFVPTVDGGPRQKRTPEGAGAHVGRMTLDPAVTAFCFAASRTAETANDANIKAHQGGVMTFCLTQALAELENLCTFEQWLQKAASKLEDIRAKYMPMMDQTIQLSFSPNSAPSEVVVFDPRYATVAQHRLSQQSESQQRGVSQDAMLSQQAPRPQPVREASTEFVPSPVYQANGSANSVSAGPGMQGNGGQVGILYVQIFGCYNLKNTDTGLFGDVSDPYVKLRVADVEHNTPTVNNDLNPVWHEHNRFTFKSRDIQGDALQLEVVNANMMRDDVLGRLTIPLATIAQGSWEQKRSPLQDGPGEIEFQIRLDPEQGSAGQNRAPPQQPQQQPVTYQAPAPQQQRPVSPPRGQDFDFKLSGGMFGGSALGVGASNVPSLAPPSLGVNIFGEPNLFAAMPDMMSTLMKGTGVPPSGGLGALPPSPSSRGLAAGAQASFTPMLSSRSPAPGAMSVSRGISAAGGVDGMLAQAQEFMAGTQAGQQALGAFAAPQVQAQPAAAAPALAAAPSAAPVAVQQRSYVPPVVQGAAGTGASGGVAYGYAQPSPYVAQAQAVQMQGYSAQAQYAYLQPQMAQPQVVQAQPVMPTAQAMPQGIYTSGALRTPSYQPAQSYQPVVYR